MLFWLLLIYIGYKIVQGYLRGREKETDAHPLTPKGEETHRDPVCGVYVAEQDAVVGRHDGQRIFFCSMACLDKYREQIENKR